MAEINFNESESKTETHHAMTNPYAPSAEPEGSIPSSAPAKTLTGNIVCFLMFAGGCVFAIHVIVAIQSGVFTAIQRTVRQPLFAFWFFTIVVIACFAATAFWRVIRKRMLADYFATPLTRFCAGVMLVMLFLMIGEIADTIIRPLAVPLNALVTGALPQLVVFFNLVVASMLSIEFEAMLVRFLSRRHN